MRPVIFEINDLVPYIFFFINELQQILKMDVSTCTRLNETQVRTLCADFRVLFSSPRPRIKHLIFFFSKRYLNSAATAFHTLIPRNENGGRRRMFRRATRVVADVPFPSCLTVIFSGLKKRNVASDGVVIRQHFYPLLNIWRATGDRSVGTLEVRKRKSLPVIAHFPLRLLVSPERFKQREG